MKIQTVIIVAIAAYFLMNMKSKPAMVVGNKKVTRQDVKNIRTHYEGGL